MLRLPATIAAVGIGVSLPRALPACRGGARAAALAAIAAGIAPGIAGFTSHLTTSTFEPIAWTGAAFLLTPRDLAGPSVRSDLDRRFGRDRHGGQLGYRGLVGRARRRRARDARAPHPVMVAALARRRDLGRLVRAESGLAMAAWLVVLRSDPAPPRQPEEFHRPILAVRVAQAMSTNLLLAPLCAAGMRGPFVDRRLADALSVVGLCARDGVLFLQRGTNYYLFPVYPTMFASAPSLARLSVWVARAGLPRRLASAHFGTDHAADPRAGAVQNYMEAADIRPHRSRRQASARR